MRAALYEAGTTTLAIGDVDIDDPAPGRVRVRVHHCGICHSDYTALHSTYGASPSVLGHEAAGIVDAVGEGVAMVAPGDKVVLTPIAPCGRCYWCQRNEPGSCVNNSAVLGGAFLDGSTGLSRAGTQVFRGLGVGGFAEYAMTSETGAVKVPDDTPLETACVNPAGSFIRAWAAATETVPPMPAITIGTPVQKCGHGFSRFQP